MRAAIGVGRLYTHQRAAWDAAARGEHVVIATGTASGKTLAFNLPVLDALARDAQAPRALPLPDEGARTGSVPDAQPRSACRGLRPAIYDGDTPLEQRRRDPPERRT